MEMLFSFVREIELEGSRVVCGVRPYWKAFRAGFMDTLLFLTVLGSYVLAMKVVDSPALEALLSAAFFLTIWFMTKRYIGSR